MDSEVTDIVARLSSSIVKSETRKKAVHRPMSLMMRDFTEDRMLDVIADVFWSPVVKKLLIPLFLFPSGLGIKETPPSRSNSPVPSEAMDKLVGMKEPERDDRFVGVL